MPLPTLLRTFARLPLPLAVCLCLAFCGCSPQIGVELSISLDQEKDMAKLTFSPLIADIRGSAADAVFAGWKGRPYVRRKVIPANPKSPAQTKVRESLARIPPLWRSLDAALRARQNEYAVSYSMSGYNWFCKNNRKTEEDYHPYLVTPPTVTLPAPTGLVLADSSGGSCKVDWDDPGLGADVSVYVLSRLIETGEVVNAYTIQEALTTLASAGTTNITLDASKSSIVVLFFGDTVLLAEFVKACNELTEKA